MSKKIEPEVSLQSLDVLKTYQSQVESDILKNILHLGEKTRLRDACEYALLNAGKRFRPALVLMLAKALRLNADVSYAALAVEYFHTASLIADDLPSMDNDDVRRKKPTVHKVYGEAIALLSSYALISAGYECITKNAEIMHLSDLPFSKNSDKIALLAIQNASYNTGLAGATGGQYLDMFPEDQSLATLTEVIQKKTISLFEISFVFGWLFGGGDLEKLEDVKKAAHHFGMAFQIADDIEDMTQDLENKHKVNVAINFGKETAFEMVQNEINAFFKIIENLKVKDDEFKEIGKELLHLCIKG
jgi:geranylgeranyl diphosphate synthase type II